MKIQIITSPRMGSTYFYNMLRSFYNPYQHFIKWNEVFNLHDRKPDQDIQKIIHDSKTNTDVVAKNHINYFQNVPHNELRQYLETINWHNIVLLRRNFFDTSLSLAKSFTTHEWTSYTEKSHNITISLELFQSCMDTNYHNIKSIIHNLYNIPYHDIIYYEDLAFNHKEDFPKLKIEKTYDYKQMRDWYPEINPWKNNKSITSSPDKKTTISNYIELKEYAQTKYHNYKSKRFVINDGYIKRINWDTRYLDIDSFNLYNDN